MDYEFTIRYVCVFKKMIGMLSPLQQPLRIVHIPCHWWIAAVGRSTLYWFTLSDSVALHRTSELFPPELRNTYFANIDHSFVTFPFMFADRYLPHRSGGNFDVFVSLGRAFSAPRPIWKSQTCVCMEHKIQSLHPRSQRWRSLISFMTLLCLGHVSAC